MSPWDLYVLIYRLIWSYTVCIYPKTLFHVTFHSVSTLLYVMRCAKKGIRTYKISEAQYIWAYVRW